MTRLLIIAAVLLPTAPIAQEWIDPEIFGADAVNQTYWYSEYGVHYGAEQYFDDNTTVWQDSQGNCIKGRWYSQAGAMCFVYDGDEVPDCWILMREQDGRITVESMNVQDDGAPTRLDLIRRSPLPISCTGPLLGV